MMMVMIAADDVEFSLRGDFLAAAAAATAIITSSNGGGGECTQPYP